MSFAKKWGLVLSTNGLAVAAAGILALQPVPVSADYPEECTNTTCAGGEACSYHAKSACYLFEGNEGWACMTILCR